MTQASRSLTRILIGAGSFADAETAIRIAERMAAMVSAEMGGVLIDETVLAEIAQLPGQRIVTSGGTLAVAPSLQRFRTLLESDARAFRETLSSVARSHTLKWSFERRSGELISGLCEAAKGWDILLLGYRAIHRRPGRVIVITPPQPAGHDAERLAGELARSLKVDVLNMVLGADGKQHEFPTANRIELESEDKLLARVSRTNASAVVVDLAAGPLRSHDQLRQLLNAARCPVVVLGADFREPQITHSTIIPPGPARRVT